MRASPLVMVGYASTPDRCSSRGPRAALRGEGPFGSVGGGRRELRVLQAGAEPAAEVFLGLQRPLAEHILHAFECIWLLSEDFGREGLLLREDLDTNSVTRDERTPKERAQCFRPLLGGPLVPAKAPKRNLKIRVGHQSGRQLESLHFYSVP